MSLCNCNKCTHNDDVERLAEAAKEAYAWCRARTRVGTDDLGWLALKELEEALKPFGGIK